MKRRNISLVCLVSLLSAYRTYTAVLKKEEKLLADCQEDLKTADSVDEIFTLVSPFLSFLDYEILEDIINNKNLGSDSDRVLSSTSEASKSFLIHGK